MRANESLNYDDVHSDNLSHFDKYAKAWLKILLTPTVSHNTWIDKNRNDESDQQIIDQTHLWPNNIKNPLSNFTSTKIIPGNLCKSSAASDDLWTSVAFVSLTGAFIIVHRHEANTSIYLHHVRKSYILSKICHNNRKLSTYRWQMKFTNGLYVLAQLLCSLHLSNSKIKSFVFFVT